RVFSKTLFHEFAYAVLQVGLYPIRLENPFQKNLKRTRLCALIYRLDGELAINKGGGLSHRGGHGVTRIASLPLCALICFDSLKCLLSVRRRFVENLRQLPDRNQTSNTGSAAPFVDRVSVHLL